MTPDTPRAGRDGFTTRVLPSSEYGRLAGTDLASVAPQLPGHAVVLVVEDRDRIVGCWAVFRCVHVEGLWIAPDHRKRAGVLRRLWTAMRAHVHSWGVASVVTGSTTDEVTSLLTRAGASQVPGTAWVLPLGQG